MSDLESLASQLAAAWRRKAADLELEFRSQSPAQTMKVDVLRRCAEQLENVLPKNGTNGTEGTDGS